MLTLLLGWIGLVVTVVVTALVFAWARPPQQAAAAQGERCPARGEIIVTRDPKRWTLDPGLEGRSLAGPGGEIPAHLRPLAGGLMTMHRPQSGVVWLRRSATARETLQDLAGDRMPCSHAALDALGADRAVEYLRLLLVRYGALPPRDRHLADLQRWAAATLDAVGNAGHRQLLERFLRWHLLRHLRSSGSTAEPFGHGPYQRAKQRLTVAIAFLA